MTWMTPFEARISKSLALMAMCAVGPVVVRCVPLWIAHTGWPRSVDAAAIFPDQPTQRTSGSFRATTPGMLVGWPTMIGATGTHSPGRPSSFFPSGVFR